MKRARSDCSRVGDARRKVQRHAAPLWILIACVLILATGAARPFAGTTLVIGVADAATGAPIVGAQVRVPSLGRIARADWLGEARIREVPTGRYAVQVHALGYAASEITLDARGDSVGAVFMLERAATRLDTMEVVATRASFALPIFREQFENRRAMGIGRFLVDSQLARLGTRNLAIALATALPGLKLAPGEGNSLILVPTQTGGNVWSMSCKLDVYLDGAVFPDSSVLTMLLPTDLAGVEYYDIVEAPPQYRRAGAIGSGPPAPNGAPAHAPATCKVLLFWSKY